jgi:hypothetical protein
VDYGAEAFWITNSQTPVWTANVAYDVRLFRDDPSLRFDQRYNRVGAGSGGGEDQEMFEQLLRRNARTRYEPTMRVQHSVEAWRLCRRYFLRRHFDAGRSKALYGGQVYARHVGGVPPFLFLQAARQLAQTAALAVRGRPDWLRQAMNFTYAVGMIAGHHARASHES